MFTILQMSCEGVNNMLIFIYIYSLVGLDNMCTFSKTVAPMNVKLCRVLETPLKVLEISVKVVYIVFSAYLVTIAARQRRGVLGENR